METSEDLKKRLHGIFDTQIPNYGDYNLVLAGGADRGHKHRHYILGYRRHPLEIVIAPFHPAPLAPGSAPVAVNRTNLSHVDELGESSFEVGTSTGKAFRFTVHAIGRLPASGGPLSIEQSDDQLDFLEFMADFRQLGQ